MGVGRGSTTIEHDPDCEMPLKGGRRRCKYRASIRIANHLYCGFHARILTAPQPEPKEQTSMDVYIHTMSPDDIDVEEIRGLLEKAGYFVGDIRVVDNEKGLRP